MYETTYHTTENSHQADPIQYTSQHYYIHPHYTRFTYNPYRHEACRATACKVSQFANLPHLAAPITQQQTICMLGRRHPLRGK